MEDVVDVEVRRKLEPECRFGDLLNDVEWATKWVLEMVTGSWLLECRDASGFQKNLVAYLERFLWLWMATIEFPLHGVLLLEQVQVEVRGGLSNSCCKLACRFVGV